MPNDLVSVRVHGDFACFTRPESKVERVSYPIMTPSAARGILEAIYWHPEFAWKVTEIVALQPVRTFGIMRNEVNSRMSLSGQGELFADRDRSQRFSVCLRDVDYVIAATAVTNGSGSDPVAKFVEVFNRRVTKGQCFHRPCLGTREFAAEFEPVAADLRSVDWSEDLGLMLWDIDYATGGKSPSRRRGAVGGAGVQAQLPIPERRWKPSGEPCALFFDAKVRKGAMAVPDQPLRTGR